MMSDYWEKWHKMPDPKLVDCGGCGMELLGESMAYLGTSGAAIYGRQHIAGRVRDGERNKPMCRWCLKGGNGLHEYDLGDPVG